MATSQAVPIAPPLLRGASVVPPDQLSCPLEAPLARFLVVVGRSASSLPLARILHNTDWKSQAKEEKANDNAT